MFGTSGISDSGVISAATIAQLAAVALAVANTIAATDIAEKELTIAGDYLKIAQEEQQYYYDLYVPCENAEVEEACSIPIYVPHPDIQIGRYKNVANQMMTGQVEDAITCSSRYCTGRKAAMIKDLMVMEAGSEASSANLGRRYEELYADAQDDLRWAKRSNALTRGRNMVAQSIDFSGMAYGLFGRLGIQAAEGAGGALGYLGYTMTRKDVSFPDMDRKPQQSDLYHPRPVQKGESFAIPPIPKINGDLPGKSYAIPNYPDIKGDLPGQSSPVPGVPPVSSMTEPKTTPKKIMG